jgi:hypothetical protein
MCFDDFDPFHRIRCWDYENIDFILKLNFHSNFLELICDLLKYHEDTYNSIHLNPSQMSCRFVTDWICKMRLICFESRLKFLCCLRDLETKSALANFPESAKQIRKSGIRTRIHERWDYSDRLIHFTWSGIVHFEMQTTIFQLRFDLETSCIIWSIAVSLEHWAWIPAEWVSRCASITLENFR